MFDWNWLWVFGEVGISYGLYRWWKSDDRFLAVLEIAPDVNIDGLKRLPESVTEHDYAVVHGLVRTIDSKNSSIIQSHFVSHCLGVIHRLTLREKKLEKYRQIWTETFKTLNDSVRSVPFRLATPSGSSIRIDKPLNFDSIQDELDVTHVKFEPNSSSSFHKIVETFLGDVSTGVETKEQMLLIDVPLTGVGRLEKRTGGVWYLIPHNKFGGILTRSSRAEVIAKYRSRSSVTRAFCICFAMAACGTAVYLLYKAYEKRKRRLMNSRTNIVSPNDVEHIDTNTNARLQCVICLENEVIYSLQPCSHLGLCHSCAQTLQSRSRGEELCPICRTPIEAYQRVFLP